MTGYKAFHNKDSSLIFAFVLQQRRRGGTIVGGRREGKCKGGEVPAVLDDDDLDLDHLHGHHHRLLARLHAQWVQHQQLHRIKHGLCKVLPLVGNDDTPFLGISSEGNNSIT